MNLEKLAIIRDVISYCFCPLLIALDFSYSALKFNSVFQLCEKWWRTLDSISIGMVIGQLPEKVTQIFEIMYGKNHLTWRCFYRSIISSLLAMSFVFFFLNAVDLVTQAANNAYEQIFTAYQMLGKRLGLSAFPVFCISMGLNLIVDYCSLLETRLVLSRIGKGGILRTFILTIIDYSFTTVLWVVSFFSLVKITNFVMGSDVVPFVKIDSFLDVIFFPYIYTLEYLRVGTIARGSGIPIGHLIGLLSLSTYFTSLVFYVFSLGSIILRIFDWTRIRVADALLNYSKKKTPGPLLLLSIALGVLSQALVAILKFFKSFF